MDPNYVSIKSFLDYDFKFNNFLNIDYNRNEELIKMSKNILNRINTNNFYMDPKSALSIRVLKMLLLDYEFKKMSFDEKLIVLINLIDPNFEALRIFISLTKNKQLDKELKEKIAASIRNAIGCYDRRIIAFEAKYKKKFINHQTLTATSTRNNFMFVKKILNSIDNFDSIDEDKMNYILYLVDNLRNTVKQYDYKYISSLLTHKDKLTSNEELALFFIIAVDPELNFLKIYEEESTIFNIETRAKEEMGFFSDDMIRLEKLYHKKFIPDKKISDWD